MTKTICINQSNYIPWRGYFDLIRKSDEFLIADSVQYTHKDWRNRNQIKTQSGLIWLTVPVRSSGRLSTCQRIEETRIADPRWAVKHLASFRHAYRKAAFFAEVLDWLEPLYGELAAESLLTVVNERLLRRFADYLRIGTVISRTSNYIPAEALDHLDRTERIILLCKAAGATRYLTAPAARTYLDEEAMASAGIEVEWMDYAGYRPYSQLWGEFEPKVSTVDLLFNMGTEAARYVGRQLDIRSYAHPLFPVRRLPESGASACQSGSEKNGSFGTT
ncbi:MAG TPA: WbqC family protein [Terracidiphilus sp.]|jgi:WbqC-like protein family|nr:WbqC family protein [Terracidiphilus sp.]